MTSRAPAPARRRAGAVLGAIALLSACSGQSPDAATGVIEVSVVNAGEGADRGGLVIVVDGRTRLTVGDAAASVLAEVEPGPHQVALRGVDAACAVADGTDRTVAAVEGDTTRVAFDLACSPGTGSIQVITTTAGVDFDPDGYLLMVDGQPALEVNDVGLYLVGAAEGVHSLELAQVSPNCRLDGDQPQTVTVTGGQAPSVSFAVSCVEVQRAGRGHEIAFTSDRDSAASGGAAVYVMNDDGTRVRRLAESLTGSQSNPAWSPDGSIIAFVGTTPNFARAITIATAEGADVRQLRMQHALDFFERLSWSPDATGILFPSRDGFCAALFLAAVDGQGEQPVPFPDPCSADDVLQGAYSPDATRLAVVTGFNSNCCGFAIGLLLTDVATQEFVPVICFGASSVAWSPDGTRLAVTSRAGTAADAGDDEIWIEDLEHHSCTQITTGFGSNTSPSWSPDGRRLAFVSTRDGNAEIYVMNVDGSDQVRLTRNPGNDTEPAWRP